MARSGAPSSGVSCIIVFHCSLEQPSSHARLSPWPRPPGGSAGNGGAAPRRRRQPQSQPNPLTRNRDDEGAIVVTGSRTLPGSAVGDIPPENMLDSRDVRATGATNITELLDAIAPQIGSARGRGGEAPVLLLNGQRISGFRELRDIPTEAISRVEILPEEVALKYGYRADQKVVNIVLRNRFRSTAVQVAGTTATDGGYAGGIGDVTRLMIDKAGRTTFNLHAEGNGMLTENERDILLSNPPLGRHDRPGPRGALADRHQARPARLGDGQPQDPRRCLGDLQWRARASGRPLADRARRHVDRAARAQHRRATAPTPASPSTAPRVSGTGP